MPTPARARVSLISELAVIARWTDLATDTAKLDPLAGRSVSNSFLPPLGRESVLSMMTAVTGRAERHIGAARAILRFTQVELITPIIHEQPQDRTVYLERLCVVRFMPRELPAS